MRDYREEIKTSGLTQKEWYRTIYLVSDHWKSLRQAAFAAHGRKCHDCGKSGILDVHHLNYKAIYDVEVSDLQILCRKCHKKEHAAPVMKPRKSKKKPCASRVPRRAKGPSILPKYGELLPDPYKGILIEAISKMKGRMNKAVNLAKRQCGKLKASPEIQTILTACKPGKAGNGARLHLKKMECSAVSRKTT